MLETDAVSVVMTTLKANSELLSKIGTYTVEGINYPMIVYNSIANKSWDIDKTCLYFYLVANIEGGLSYRAFWFNIMCRAANFIESREVATLVYKTLNRLNRSDVGITTSVMPTLTPTDGDKTIYVTPLQVKVKSG